ncbi:MAG: DUF6442 family protein [Oscillospiraceae bacterium]|nr:DUF6442 family protein [Oscillospiraceae bacterium]
MNRAEILEKARKENKGADIVELEVQSKARGIAGAGMLVLGALLNLIGSLVYDRSCSLFPVMFCSYAAIQGISQFILGKRRGSTKLGAVWLLYGLLMTAFTAAFICFLFRDMKAGRA